MKYKQGQEIIIVLGKLTGERGWIIENNNPGWKNSGMPYLVGLDSGSGEHMSEEYLMSLDELQQLRAENEALKAKHSSLIAQLTVLSGNIKDSQHAFYRLEQIRLLLIEVQNEQLP